MDILPTLKPGFLVVVYASHAARDEISHVATELALRGPVTVLDGGNRFQPYRIAQLLRRHTVDVSTAANRIFVRRAFTCYQMLALLEDTPARQHPYLVLDLLTTFYDEQVSLQEAHRLLEACLSQLIRIGMNAPVAVTLGAPTLEERIFLVEKVCARADVVFMKDAPVSQDTQLSLF